MPSNDISCGTGYWGCIANCCEGSQGTEKPSIPLTNGNSPSTNQPDVVSAGSDAADSSWGDIDVHIVASDNAVGSVADRVADGA